MANNFLYLRTLSSPYIGNQPDITRGSVLSHNDVDNNFIFLKGEDILTATTSGTTIILHKVNSNIIEVDLATMINGQDTFTTGSTLVGSTLVFNTTDALSAYTADLSPLLDDTNFYTTGSTLIGDTVYFDRTDTLSAYTLDLSSLDVNDTFVTGGTISYVNEAGTATFTNNEGGTFQISGFTDTQTTGSTLVGSTLYFNRNDALSAYTADLSPLLDDTNFYTTGTTLVGTTAYFDRTDTLSAYTLDLSSFIDNTNFYTTGVTVIDNVAYFDRTDTLSAYTLNLSGYVENNAVTTTYSGLTSLISSSGLTAGTWYQFPYYTKHLIGGTVAEYNDTSVHYDDGTGVKSTLVPETETLSVLALSSSVIHVEAKSTQHPNDRIYYDINDNLTEDSLESRPGFIIYREDTINSISAHYDWRNVLHRRFDMDPTSARTTDVQTMLGYDSSSNSNHANSDVDIVGSFAIFETSGRTDIGALNTTTEGTYRDFKTFVGLDTDVFSSPDLRGRYLNIHIANSHSQARIIGSGFGGPVPDGNTITSNLYGEIANVVFFTRSAENVTIGRNASGVMIVGKTVKDIVIGDNNENIIIGGKNSRPTYVGTTATTKNFVENIEIGNNNRNVMISGANRRVTIGNNNVGVIYQGEGTDNTLGSYNTLVYSYLSHNNKLGDWMTNIRITNSSNAVIKSESQTIDLISCYLPNYAGYLNTFTTATFPDGFDITTGQTNFSSTATIYIGDRSTNVMANHCSPLYLESQVANINLYASASVKIGSDSKDITLIETLYTTIGKDVAGVEASATNGLEIGDSTTGVKVISTLIPAPYKIGEYCSNIGIYGGVFGDIEIGNACSNVFISGTGASKIKIGNNNTDIITRNSAYVTIGNENTDIFLEGSNYNTIGNFNTNITLADVGAIYKPGFPSFTTYSFVYNDAQWGRDYAGRTYLTGSTAPFSSNDWVPSLGSWYGLNPFPNGRVRGCAYTTIGNNCDEVFIVDSDYCVVRDNTTNVAIGSYATSSNVYTLGNTSGYMNSIDITAATGNTVVEGQLCHETVIGANCDSIIVRGDSQSGNTFYDNVTSVQAVSGFTFTNNRVFVDGVAVTATTSYDGVNFDKNSPDNHRWEYGIDNAGAFASSTKLQ